MASQPAFVADRDLNPPQGIGGPYALAKRIQHGIPVAALERLSAKISPGDATFKYKIVPKATYGRRKGKQLSLAEGEAVARLSRLFSFATEVFGDDDLARDFLHNPHPLLDDEAPIDVAIATAPGAEAVTNILGALKYGNAA